MNLFISWQLVQMAERQMVELRAKLASSNQAKDDLQLRYDVAEVQHQVDTNASLNNLRQQLEVAHHAEIHRVRQEGLHQSFSSINAKF